MPHSWKFIVNVYVQILPWRQAVWNSTISMEGMLYLLQNIWKTWCVLFKGRLCTSHGSALLPINETLYQRNVTLSAPKNAWRYAAISLKDAAFLQMMTDEKHAVDPLIYFDTVFKKHRLFQENNMFMPAGENCSSSRARFWNTFIFQRCSMRRSSLS